MEDEEILVLTGDEVWCLASDGRFINYETGEVTNDIGEIDRGMRIWTTPVVCGYCNSVYLKNNVPYSKFDYQFTKYIYSIEYRFRADATSFRGSYDCNGVVNVGSVNKSLLHWLATMPNVPPVFCMRVNMGGYVKIRLKDGYDTFVAKYCALKGR